MYFLKLERETNTFYIRIFYVLLCKTFFGTMIEFKESDKLYEMFYTCFVNTLRAYLHIIHLCSCLTGKVSILEKLE